MKANTGIAIAKETISEFFQDNAFRLSAALAYYAVFSLGPLLIIVIGLASLAVGASAVRGELTTQLEGFIGPDAAGFIEKMISAPRQEHSIIATILGFIALFVGATGVFGQLQDALNTIWEVKPKPGSGVWGFVKSRFLSFSMILGIGFLLLISMVISTLVQLFNKYLERLLSMPDVAIQALHYGISFGIITVLFAMIFKVLPDVKLQWRDVWIGAIGTALLFTLGKYGISAYIGKATANSTFGAAGALVVILLWVYYSSLILFLGAEFTQVYAARIGSRIVPSAGAVPVTKEERWNQGMAAKRPEFAGAPDLEPSSAPLSAITPRRPHGAVRLGTIAISVAILAGRWFLRRKAGPMAHRFGKKRSCAQT